MEFPLVVSYYTRETLYQLEVQNLIASCEKWGVRHHIEPIASFGSWERNCAYKPLFLLEKLQQFNRPLFWVDADAVFLKEPSAQAVFTVDVAVRINSALDRDHPSYVMSGSLYVNATVGAERILKSWAKECIDQLANPQRTQELWDQVALRDVIQRGVPGARIGSLPTGYTTIIGHPDDEREIADKIIGHHQASRRFKKMINDSTS